MPAVNKGRRTIGGLCLLVGLFLTPISSSVAGMPIFFVTHQGQDALLLGTVVAVGQDSIQFQPEVTISGQVLHTPITIRKTKDPVRQSLQPSLDKGDQALVSIDKDGTAYKFAYGASTVSSLNPATLRILDSHFRFDDALMLQWYVNSCGQGADFVRNGSTLSVKHPNGTWLPIAQKGQTSWVPLRKADFYPEACHNLAITHHLNRIMPWLVTAIAGVGTFYLVYRFNSVFHKSLSR